MCIYRSVFFRTNRTFSVVFCQPAFVRAGLMREISNIPITVTPNPNCSFTFLKCVADFA